MKIDNQIIKEESNKDMLEELKSHSDKIWDMHFKFKSYSWDMIKKLHNSASQIDKIIENYEKEGQEDE